MMTRRTLYIGIAAAIAVVAIWNTMSTTAAVAPPARETETPDAYATPSPIAVAPSPPEDDLSTVSETEPYTYALSLDELAGLPPDAPVGSELQIWVAWEPPITKHPQVQELVDGVHLEKIAPPVTDGGPYVAILRMDRRAFGRLVWGDRYGSLSAVVISG